MTEFKIYSFPDEMTVSEEFDVFFVLIPEQSSEEYVIVRNSDSLSGLSLLWNKSTNVSDKVYIKRELGLSEAGFIIKSLVNELMRIVR